MDNTTNWLDQLLIELDWTPAELAKASKLDSAVISNIRNGRRQIGIDTAKAIGKATGRPPEVILRMAGILDPEPPENEEITKILHEVEGLSADEQREVLSYIRYRKNQARKGRR